MMLRRSKMLSEAWLGVWCCAFEDSASRGLADCFWPGKGTKLGNFAIEDVKRLLPT